ncbi:MAG: DUF4347 domain-containing protein [Leptolyngbya sp. UWPOB_LEPTO1]|uniref:PA14 domain-containing protein n=1 Tax=Leptolyngbya sp. UWPOB_LEPTO1 TaxID=2815653 RepID=UPI001ACE5289|nr:PA14 domain-containing protein [Leptolyngbya sp. UWPOB_LEPTO1]MBN8562674.1 DUF4347 domain-containing protein [Leptolyngbya sp. UWPOB_LEPTO1]
MQNLLNSSSVFDLNSSPVGSRPWFDSASSLSQSSASRIVFIDSAIAQAHTLASSVIDGTKIVLLDSHKDGIDQISQVLASYQNVESVYIASHGSINSLSLGNATLDLATITTYQDRLATWATSLAPNADILLYGCNVALGDPALIQQLSQITGADVAASTDATGNLASGGNWILEAQTGAIESPLLFDLDRLAGYTSLLETGNGLFGQYFDNIDFTNLRLTRTDATVNFNWGSGSPDPLIGADTFSIRWTGQILAPVTGTYTFFTTTDDGNRLFINGQQVINNYRDQAATERSGTINLVAGQRYNIAMDYYENGGLASARLQWSAPGITKQVVPQSQLFSTALPPVQPGTGNGLQGEYFDNIDFTNLRVTRTDATVNFNWGTGSPAPSIAADTFSVRWTGQVQPLYSDTYTFFTTTDDGVRLFVNNQLVIDSFIDQAATERTGTIALQAGLRYDIRMEYYERGGRASALLGWLSPNQVRQIIPQAQLYSGRVTVNPGTIVIGTNAVTVNESAGTAAVRVDRINGSDGVATVRYTTANGSGANAAIAGQDYTLTEGVLTFAAGETSKTVTIPILNDATTEATEEFGFGLGETTGAALGTNRTALIQIIDDDAVDSSYAFSSENFNVNENAGAVTITVQRSGNTTVAGSVNYATSNGPATAGADYTTSIGTLNFAAGQTNQTFTVPITDDTEGERNETFNIILSNPSAGILGTQQTATVTIADNDPGSFAREAVITGLFQPTAFDWTPGGEYLFIAQKNGVVRVARNGVLQQTPAVDISAIVNSPRDRGLLGLAVHPQFFSGSPYVYLLYSYDPPETASQTDPEAVRDGVGNRASRLGRFTATITNGIVSINPASEVVILGKNSTWQNISRPDENSTNNFNIPESGRNSDGTFVQDFLNLDSESHAIGTVKFGTDGFLYVSNGDGASYNAVDPRAVRTLNIDSLSGKILRIDPITGNAPASNPFYDGNPQSNRSKVWQLGLRNPFRFTINRQNGQPYIGDVGWTKWEEVNTGGPGANFGWVAYEGGNGTSNRTGGYQDLPSVQAFYAGPQTGLTAPIYAYQHFGSGGNAIAVGDFYTGNTFPSIYDNNLFITDLSKGTVDALVFDANGVVVGQRRFASGVFGLAQITTGSDGNLYYASLGSGEIGRWRPIG